MLEVEKDIYKGVWVAVGASDFASLSDCLYIEAGRDSTGLIRQDRCNPAGAVGFVHEPWLYQVGVAIFADRAFAFEGKCVPGVRLAKEPRIAISFQDLGEFSRKSLVQFPENLFLNSS